MKKKYTIQQYSRYPIYEPAEGGYYYEGLEPDNDEDEMFVYDTKVDAIDTLRIFVVEENAQIAANGEGYLVLSSDGTCAYSINHKYVGEGEEYYVEPLNRRGQHTKGHVPYC